MGTDLCSEAKATADNIFLTFTRNVLMSLQIKSRSEPRKVGLSQGYTQEEEKGRE